MIFRHNKSGGLYVFICEGQMESNPEQRMAVYKSLQDGKVWIRSMDEFSEVERFAPIEVGAYTSGYIRVHAQDMLFGRSTEWSPGRQSTANGIADTINQFEQAAKTDG